MGRSSAELTSIEKRLVAFDLANMRGGKVDGRFRLLEESRTLHPEFLSSMILSHIKNILTNNYELKEEQRKLQVVISVPAYFTQKQGCITRNAGKIAGLEVLCIVSEPTAGAYAYELQTCLHTSRKILVYDFGGGTFESQSYK